MFEVARYESERRAMLALTIVIAAAFYGTMFVAIAPSFTDLDLASLFAELPKQLTEGLGIESMNTLSGILAVELYQVGWLLVLGIYLAYNAASMIAGEIESGRIDSLLAAPVSRTRLAGEEFLSLLLPILAINAVTPIVLAVAASVLDQTLDPVNLVVLHALAVPYLLCCAAVGFVFSVFFTDESHARIAAVGTLVVTYLLETVFIGTDYEILGIVAPMNYIDPTAILVDGSYDLAGGAILLVAAVVLVLVGLVRFGRMDIG
ncbi:ABC transporter permease subunit [Halococcus qingdaonensis]|uniref:ABC transporter permease subunit n=1 Tax=Halococcus qingdaonensis TaxID=224402 RepID=UPI002115E97A|nr:ABC transporter permease subunit [Halococcus qingdaonensis]